MTLAELYAGACKHSQVARLVALIKEAAKDSRDPKEEGGVS